MKLDSIIILSLSVRCLMRRNNKKNTVLAFCMNVTPHVRNANVRTGGENWYCGQVFAVSVILKLFNRQRKRIVHAAWSYDLLLFI